LATTFRTQKEERKEDLMSTSLQRNFMVSVRNVPKLPCGKRIHKKLMEVYIFEKRKSWKIKDHSVGRS
jgi:hypothetical protein